MIWLKPRLSDHFLRLWLWFQKPVTMLSSRSDCQTNCQAKNIPMYIKEMDTYQIHWIWRIKNMQMIDCFWLCLSHFCSFPDSKVHGANMRPIWGRQEPGRPHVGPINFAIWVRIGMIRKVASILLAFHYYYHSAEYDLIFNFSYWRGKSDLSWLLL